MIAIPCDLPLVAASHNHFLPLAARCIARKCNNFLRQLESAASDMARMSMDYADLGEQLQVGQRKRRAAAAVRARAFDF